MIQRNQFARSSSSVRWSRAARWYRPDRLPSADVPFRSRTPTTLKGRLLTRIVWPRGSVAPKRFLRTVSPITATLSRIPHRPGEKTALLKIPHLDVEKLRFGTSDTRVPVVVSIDNLCGRRSSRRSRRDRRTLMKDAVMSSYTSDLVAPQPILMPPRETAPDPMNSTFDPRLHLVLRLCCAPCPTLTMAITAATPIMMPSIVSADRSLLRAKARIAMRRI